MEYRVACRREDNGWRWKATCQTVTRVHVFTHESSSRAPRVQVGSNRSPFRRPNPLRHGYSIVPFNVIVTQYAAAFACTHSISSLPPPALNHFQSRYFGSRFSLGGSRRCEAPRHVATFVHFIYTSRVTRCPRNGQLDFTNNSTVDNNNPPLSSRFYLSISSREEEDNNNRPVINLTVIIWTSE